MSATNATPIINLPLFIGTDKPAWLVDWNGAMNTIDTAIANLQTAESGTATSLASLAQSVEALSGTVSQHTTAIQTVTNATAANTGSINTINSLIGKGEPTTEDKTIIGAINEIYAEIGGGDGVEASDVVYSNTSSGLAATDVQAAIDEVNAKIPQGGSVDADDVAYDNKQSGLTATNVQDAIDEVAAAGSGLSLLTSKYDLATNNTITIDWANHPVVFINAGDVLSSAQSAAGFINRISTIITKDDAKGSITWTYSSNNGAINYDVTSTGLTVTLSANSDNTYNNAIRIFG